MNNFHKFAFESHSDKTRSGCFDQASSLEITGNGVVTICMLPKCITSGRLFQHIFLFCTRALKQNPLLCKKQSSSKSLSLQPNGQIVGTTHCTPSTSQILYTQYQCYMSYTHIKIHTQTYIKMYIYIYIYTYIHIRIFVHIHN